MTDRYCNQLVASSAVEIFARATHTLSLVTLFSSVHWMKMEGKGKLEFYSGPQAAAGDNKCYDQYSENPDSVFDIVTPSLRRGKNSIESSTTDIHSYVEPIRENIPSNAKARTNTAEKLQNIMSGKGDHLILDMGNVEHKRLSTCFASCRSLEPLTDRISCCCVWPS